MSTDGLANALLQGADALLTSDEACLNVAKEAEEVARYFAHNLSEREEEIDLDDEASIFDALGLLWTRLADSFDPSTSSQQNNKGLASEDARIQLALALAKLERNLIAGLQAFQDAAEPHQPAIRKLIFDVTTFVRVEDPRFYTLQAVLTQLLCNLISPTSAEPGADRLAEKHLPLYLSGSREDDVIVRLLDSRDKKTNHATLHLLNNIVRNSPARLELLLSEPGVRWCAKILGRMDEWVEVDDGLFELGAFMFNSMIPLSLHPKLFDLLGDSDEAITPSQTTLLKILDSHLSSSSPLTPTASPNPNTFLIPLFHTLTLYTLSSIRQGADDSRLPKIFEGLILVTEGLSAIGLAAQSRKDSGDVIEIGGDEEMVGSMKQPEEGKGVVKPCIELLRSLDTFFPRVNPRSRPSEPTTTSTPLATEELKPFVNLKRNLVQLLGILTFGDTSVGDQIRGCEGIQLLLSMTEIDESNPYLREHALFCVRNVMQNNPANQAIITQMNPIGVLSEETGELLPVPEKMKKK